MRVLVRVVLVALVHVVSGGTTCSGSGGPYGDAWYGCCPSHATTSNINNNVCSIASNEYYTERGNVAGHRCFAPYSAGCVVSSRDVRVQLHVNGGNHLYHRYQEVSFWYTIATGVRQLVHGTFMTRAAWRVRTATGREIAIGADAMHRGTATVMQMVKQPSSSSVAATTSLAPWRNLAIDEIVIETSELTVSVRSDSWQVNITSKPIYGLVQPLLNETHIHGRWEADQRRFDVQIMGAFPQEDVHGVIGQGYREGMDGMHGRMDEYGIEMHPELANSDGMLPVMTTSAQAEGALDGMYTDYMLKSGASPEFKFSTYHRVAKAGAARDLLHTRARSASTSEWDGVPGGLQRRPRTNKREL